MGTVREASEADAVAVRGVWESVAAEGMWIGTELPLREDWTDRFNAALHEPRQTWFVAEVEDMVVGAIYTGHERGLGHLGMAILDGHRGRGIGRALLSSSIDWAMEQRCHKVVLEVWPHNERARALYSSAGFQEEGYMKRHYRRRSGALWDAVAMGLVLDTNAPGHPTEHEMRPRSDAE